MDKNGYLYPRSNQAQSVVDVLCMEASNLGIKIKTNEQVIAIETEKNGRNFQVLTKGWHYEADALILANGSKASSISGSDGSGYELADIGISRQCPFSKRIGLHKTSAIVYNHHLRPYVSPF